MPAPAPRESVTARSWLGSHENSAYQGPRIYYLETSISEAGSFM